MRFPARLGLGARLFQVNFIIDVIDPGERNEMMRIASIDIVAAPG